MHVRRPGVPPWSTAFSREDEADVEAPHRAVPLQALEPPEGLEGRAQDGEGRRVLGVQAEGLAGGLLGPGDPLLLLGAEASSPFAAMPASTSC